MTQIATVERILDADHAEISVPRKSACGHDCEECAGCGVSGASLRRASAICVYYTRTSCQMQEKIAGPGRSGACRAPSGAPPPPFPPRRFGFCRFSFFGAKSPLRRDFYPAVLHIFLDFFAVVKYNRKVSAAFVLWKLGV